MTEINLPLNIPNDKIHQYLVNQCVVALKLNNKDKLKLSIEPPTGDANTVMTYMVRMTNAFMTARMEALEIVRNYKNESYIEMFKRGMTQAEIARDVGKSREYVRQVLKRWDISGKPPKKVIGQ